jgi:hypothetical protein
MGRAAADGVGEAVQRGLRGSAWEAPGLWRKSSARRLRASDAGKRRRNGDGFVWCGEEQQQASSSGDSGPVKAAKSAHVK